VVDQLQVPVVCEPVQVIREPVLVVEQPVYYIDPEEEHHCENWRRRRHEHRHHEHDDDNEDKGVRLSMFSVVFSICANRRKPVEPV
jgi:hypothetical protein